MSSGNKPTRSEQREAARAMAKQLREQGKKTERRKRLVLQLSVAAAAIGLVAIVASVIVNGVVNGSSRDDTPVNITAEGGIKIGTNLEAFTSSHTPSAAPSSATGGAIKPVEIVTYVDYQCPYCGYFEQANQSQLRGLVESGVATLEVRPLSFLDGRGSPNEYSSRAANAAYCVASFSPDNFFNYNAVLFAHQPEEGTPGPSNDELISRVKEVAAKNSEKITSCINKKSFANWITTTTNNALGNNAPGTQIPLQGTPLVLVNGQEYKGAIDSAAEFAAFVAAQQK